MIKSCLEYVTEVLKSNPDREYNAAQMRKHLSTKYSTHYATTTVAIALKKLHDTNLAERIRDGQKAFRYSLANTN